MWPSYCLLCVSYSITYICVEGGVVVVESPVQVVFVLSCQMDVLHHVKSTNSFHRDALNQTERKEIVYIYINRFPLVKHYSFQYLPGHYISNAFKIPRHFQNQDRKMCLLDNQKLREDNQKFDLITSFLGDILI